MSTTFHLALALGLALSLPAAAEEHHVSEAGGIRILHAWTPASTAAEGFVFMEVANSTAEAVKLTGGAVGEAGSVSLVGYAYRDGADTWTELPGIEVAPGSEVALAPDGLALRVTGWTAPRREGDEVEAEVMFGDLRIEVRVAVEAADATAHGHAGHAH